MKLGTLPTKQNLCANNTSLCQILDPLKGHSTVLLSKEAARGNKCIFHQDAVGRYKVQRL